MEVISELIQGREFAKQLQNHLDPSTPHETREFLIQKIISTYNNLLQITNPSGKNSSFQMDHNSHQISFHGNTKTDSPCSASHFSDLDDRGSPSKRRKTLTKSVKKVEVRAEGGEERNISDGYNWRKYGQKAILGAKFPRSYYRCTHLHTRGCPATKQVQKSNEDPTIFQVSYRGHHTCSPQPIHISQRSTNQAPSPHQDIQPRFKVEEDLDIFSAYLGDLVSVSASPNTYDSSHLLMSTPESHLIHQHGGSAPDSPFSGFEFLLDDFDIQPNFPFDGPEFMLG